MEIIKIITPTQIRELEKEAVEKQNLSHELLMENAAHALFRTIEDRFFGFKIIIVNGPGNNGGDGVILARILESEDWDVKLSFKGFDKEILTDKSVVVDAIFGIGLNRDLDDFTASIISKINSSPAKVIAVDIPTGVNALTGEIMGNIAVKADITVSFLSAKSGMFLFPGANYCGEIIISPISVKQELINSYKGPCINSKIELKQRSIDSHKCSNGKVLTIAGSEEYHGAAYFSSFSPLLVGAGYSTLITTLTTKLICAGLAPEIIYKTDEDLEHSIKESTSVIFGPGLGINHRSRNLLKEILKLNPQNLIIDADGLNLLSEDLNLLDNIKTTFVITPHPGEMSRLTGKSIKEIEKNRVTYAEDFSKKYNCIVVLKGVYTVIAAPDSETYININSSTTLATAGTGDILSGIIAGLTSYATLIDAVRAAVYIHGISGKIAEEEIGKVGVTASDILKNIPRAYKRYI